MKTKLLSVVITGDRNSGKTLLASQLIKALTELGVAVVYKASPAAQELQDKYAFKTPQQVEEYLKDTVVIIHDEN